MTGFDREKTRRDVLQLGLSATAAAFAVPSLANAQATASGPYKEAPQLAARVRAGQLPPVAERLPVPDDVLVIKPTERVGTYGGTIRSFMLNEADWPAPQNACLNYGLMMFPRDIEAFGKGMPMRGWEPVVAKSYSWKDDATQLTITLRKGMKWSDGAPFTSEDVMFAWHDVWFNKDLQPAPPSTLLVDGKSVRLSAPDESTLVFDFPGPYPTFIFTALRHSEIVQYPKHYLKQFHPKYTPSATVKDFLENSARARNIVNFPSVSPWVCRRHDTATITMERNPFFYGIDTAGNQLPYADAYDFPMVGTTQNAVLKVVAGEIDMGERNLQFFENLPVMKENERRGNYKLLFYRGGSFAQPTGVLFNYACTDPAEPELRDLLRNKDFRIALSIGIDREEVRNTVLLGLGRAASYALNTTSPLFDDEFKKITMINGEFDQKRANALLDGLGLKKDRGVRRYANGKPVSIVLDVISEFTGYTRTGDIVIAAWRELGLDAKVNTVARSVMQSRIGDKTIHAFVFGPDAPEIPLTRIDTGPFNLLYSGPGIYRPEGPIPEHAKLLEFHSKIYAEADPAKSIQLHKDMARHVTETALNFQLATDLPVLIVRSNRMGNVPEVGLSLQTFIYERPEQFFIKA